MLTARQVAEYFLTRADEAGEPLSPGELQTLCFYAQGFHLGVRLAPMFGDELFAEADGPCVGALRSDDLAPPPHLSVPQDAGKLLEHIYDERRSLLAALPRWNGLGDCQRGEPIPHEAIRRAFAEWAKEHLSPPPEPASDEEIERVLGDDEFRRTVDERVRLSRARRSDASP